ncbi:MAG: hypothetical protein AB7L41_08295 [Flavobacteriaceae bacterium]
MPTAREKTGVPASIPGVPERLLAALFLVAACSAGAADPMTGDGPGCTDKARAAELAGLDDFDPGFIAIWAEGMQDASCRGYSAGQQVTVDERDEGLACVRAEDDEACFWVSGKLAPD